MKIVIEIDKDRYEDTKRIASVQMNYRKPTIEQIVANGTPLDDVFDKIRAEIEMYEADCILADDSKECKECDKIVFESIYRIIDKYRKEQE